jgi:methionyl-tRNA formyltransferase
MFGLRCLKEIAELDGIELCGVLTNPRTFSISYNKSGVTNVLHADVLAFAEEKNIPSYCMQENMKEEGLQKFIEEVKPDFAVVAGWYHMIPPSLLEKFPWSGLHASLLPDYSGGAPLVWAIINGEEKTGISFFLMDKGVDNGDIIGQAETEIFWEDTIASLYARIEILGVDLLKEKLPLIAEGKVKYKKQDETLRKVYPQRSEPDGLINWKQEAFDIYNFVRAQTKPYPGAFTFIGGHKMRVWAGEIIDEEMTGPKGSFLKNEFGSGFITGDKKWFRITESEMVEE